MTLCFPAIPCSPNFTRVLFNFFIQLDKSDIFFLIHILLAKTPRCSVFLLISRQLMNTFSKCDISGSPTSVSN